MPKAKETTKFSNEVFELPVPGQTLKEPERIIETYQFRL